MTRAQPKFSSTDEHARRIARAIAKGRPPPFSADLDQYCETCSGEVFAAFAGAARHMPPVGKDEPLGLGYLFLLQQLLERLRYRTDRGYADAAKLIRDFQADVVAQVETGRVHERMLSLVTGALHQSNIPASPEFVAASARQSIVQPEPNSLPADVRTALCGVLEACGSNPFAAVGSLMEACHGMSAETRVSLAAALAVSGVSQARDVAVLVLLDPSSAVRRAVAGALVQVASSLTPTDVRRLITMRNWRPEIERAEVDAIIRKARAAGVDCAQWDAGGIEAIVATAVDGAAAQGFLLISPAGRRKRLSSVLTKGGVADAWSGEPEPRREIEASLARMGMEAPTLVVSRAYLDRVVAHQLALGAEKGEAPPFGLLQVVETIGGADWQPARMAVSDMVAELVAEVPETMREPATTALISRHSDRLPAVQIVAQSWFEDDPQVAASVERARGREHAKLVTYLLQSVIARHRDRWADIILRTALWMREAPLDASPCWRELAIVAKALADGRDLAEIGLMRDIASRTIAVLTNVEPT